MKAIRIHRFGPTEEVLQYEDIPTPEPGSQEVLVKVEAASLNRADLGLRRGSYRVRPEDLPLIPGREFAGTVAAIGSGVQDFQLGQRVVAHPGMGGYAEYATVRVSKSRPVPEGVESVVAAAMPTVFLTAWFALTEDGKIKSGDQVLIQAGGSGVGIAAIQIARHAGAQVITTAGTDEKCRRLHTLGANEAINYTVQDFKKEVLRLTGNRGVDVVLEMVGGEVYTKSLEVLAPGGRLVSIGGAVGPVPDPPPLLREGRKSSRFSITSYLSSHPEAFNQLDAFLGLVQDNKLQVVIGRTFPLEEARAAQRYLEGREHFGKVVLTI
ncbi:MAG: zinc-binding dehydrogenase [Deltaproteobacteria bacterium]|nr:zinc-binding dehydrogenase [Deltaproteobacteria bacterium]